MVAIKLRKKSRDLYAGLPNREQYLPKYETDLAIYRQRIDSTPLRNYYKEIINHISSVISFIDFPIPSPITVAQDLGLGYNIRNLLDFADRLALRDGGLYIDISDRSSLTLVTVHMIGGINQTTVSYYPVNSYQQKTIPIADLVPYYYNHGIPELNNYQFLPYFQQMLEVNLAYFELASIHLSTIKSYAKPILIRTKAQLLTNTSEDVLTFEGGNKSYNIGLNEEVYFLQLSPDNVAVIQSELERMEAVLATASRRIFEIGREGTPVNNTRSATEVEAMEQQFSLEFSSFAQAKVANVSRLLSAFYTRHMPEFADTTDVVIYNPYDRSRPIDTIEDTQ